MSSIHGLGFASFAGVKYRRIRSHATRLSAASLALALAAAGCGAPDDFGEALGVSELAVKKVCGTSGKTLKGIDVSKWQATIDWAKVAGDGVKFAIARASHGLNFDDAYFTANWQGMKANGIVRGVYQFFAPTQDPMDLFLPRDSEQARPPGQ